MIHGLGALLIILSCGAVGWQKKQELRRRVCSLEDAQEIAELLQIGVCDRRVPLPVLLPELESAFPQYFSGAQSLYENIRGIPFCEFWKACVRAAGVTQEAADCLTKAVEAITHGQEPERAMDSCFKQLQRSRENAVACEREKGKLYLAFGTGAGCLLALILL